MGLLRNVWDALFGKPRCEGIQERTVPNHAIAPSGHAAPRLQEESRESSREAFLAGLPIEFALCGHIVRFELTIDRKVHFRTIEEADTAPKSYDVHDWKWMAFHRRPHPTATPDELKAFFSYFLTCPAGIRVLTFSKRDHLNERRLKAITYSFDAWRRLHGPKDARGRLKEAMFCIAYVETGRAGWDNCSSRTKDASGLCRHHKHAEVKTLWNHEPFSEWDQIHDRVDETVAEIDRERAEAETQRAAEVERERARREAKWKHVAANIQYTATDRQIYLLLDLGANADDLRGIDKAQASDLIARMLNGSRDRRGSRK